MESTQNSYRDHAKINSLYRANPQKISTSRLYPSTYTLSPPTSSQKTLQDTPLNDTLHNYNGIIGSLRYLADSTRPDIVHATSTLTTYITNHSHKHWQAALSVLKFLNGTVISLYKNARIRMFSI